MRSSFIQELSELAEKDTRVMLLTGDLGYSIVEAFQKKFPRRFLNVGVAEQNMVGVATGLAEAGFIPFVYSISTFAALRPYEFIRNGPVLHGLPVRIIGVGQGFEYGHNGMTHYALEDVGVMRTQPGISVIVPCDNAQARSALRQTWDMPGPVYYRLSKNRKSIPALSGSFEIGRTQVIGDGQDILFISMGSVVGEVLGAAALLEKKGIRSTVAVVSSIRPAPENDLAALLSSFSAVIVAEAHYISGGLGSLVSEIAAERGIACRVVRAGVRHNHGKTGSESWLHEVHGLSARQLAATASRELQETRK